MKITLALAATLVALKTSSAIAAPADALTCEYEKDSQDIACEVTGREADITAIKLNAGDCYMIPPPSPDVRKDYMARAKSAGPLDANAQRWFQQIIGSKLSSMRQSGTTWESEISQAGSAEAYLSDIDPRYQVDPAVAYFIFNPVRKFRTGEVFYIQTAGCQIWQWELTVNGQPAKWSYPSP